MDDKALENLFDLEDVHQDFYQMLQSISLFKTQMTSLQNEIRTVEKKMNKKMRSIQKYIKKHKGKGNKQPSGFARPTKISTKLCEFMKKPEGTQLARTEVTQYLIQYIKDNDLQYAENRKVIKPDASLSELLELTDSEELTYFNLQTYMNKHFLKM